MPSYRKMEEKNRSPLARKFPDCPPNPAELADRVEAVGSHVTAEDLVRVPHAVVEGAVVFGGDDAETQEADAAGVEGDPALAQLRRVHLRAAATGSSQHVTIVQSSAAGKRGNNSLKLTRCDCST